MLVFISIMLSLQDTEKQAQRYSIHLISQHAAWSNRKTDTRSTYSCTGKSKHILYKLSKLYYIRITEMFK